MPNQTIAGIERLARESAARFGGSASAREMVRWELEGHLGRAIDEAEREAVARGVAAAAAALN